MKAEIQLHLEVWPRETRSDVHYFGTTVSFKTQLLYPKTSLTDHSTNYRHVGPEEFLHVKPLISYTEFCCTETICKQSWLVFKTVGWRMLYGPNWTADRKVRRVPSFRNTYSAPKGVSISLVLRYISGNLVSDVIERLDVIDGQGRKCVDLSKFF